MALVPIVVMKLDNNTLTNQINHFCDVVKGKTKPKVKQKIGHTQTLFENAKK